MSINVSTYRVQYTLTGTGQTLSVPFYFLEDSHLKVIRTQSDGTKSTLALTTDYSVSGAGDESGGSITLGASAAVATDVITIKRSVPKTQSIDYIYAGRFPAETHEKGLDKLTMLIQEHEEVLGRTLRFEEDEDAVSVMTESGRASKVLGFDSDGNVQYYNPSSVVGVSSPARQYANVAAMVADATINGVADGASVVLHGYYAIGDFGLPIRLVVETSTGGVKSHTLSDGRYANLYADHVNVGWYGPKYDSSTTTWASAPAAVSAYQTTFGDASGDPVSYDWIALQSAILAAYAARVEVHVPASGDGFSLSHPLDCSSNATPFGVVMKGVALSGTVFKEVLIHSTHSDEAIVDFSGSVKHRWEGLTFLSEPLSSLVIDDLTPTHEPATGFLFSRVGADAGAGTVQPDAGRHFFDKVNVQGYFTNGAVLQMASEGNQWSNSEIRNYKQGGLGLGILGKNYFSQTSAVGLTYPDNGTTGEYRGGNSVHRFLNTWISGGFSVGASGGDTTAIDILITGGDSESITRDIVFNGLFTPYKTGEAVIKVADGTVFNLNVIGGSSESEKTYSLLIDDNATLDGLQYLGFKELFESSGDETIRGDDGSTLKNAYIDTRAVEINLYDAEVCTFPQGAAEKVTIRNSSTWTDFRSTKINSATSDGTKAWITPIPPIADDSGDLAPDATSDKYNGSRVQQILQEVGGLNIRYLNRTDLSKNNRDFSHWLTTRLFSLREQYLANQSGTIASLSVDDGSCVVIGLSGNLSISDMVYTGTIDNFQNPAGIIVTMLFVQDATGGRILTLAGSKFPDQPSINPEPNSITRLTFIKTHSNLNLNSDGEWRLLSKWGGENEVLIKETSISSAQILDLTANPVQVSPAAPPSGYYYEFISADVFANNNAAYAVPNSLYFRYAGSAAALSATVPDNLLVNTSDLAYSIPKYPVVAGTGAVGLIEAAKAIELYAPTSPPTTGNGTLKVRLFYRKLKFLI